MPVGAHDSKDVLSIYCAGCNARFHRVPEPGVCPQCGAVVDAADSVDPLSETMLWKAHEYDSTSDEIEELLTEDADELDRLLGRKLHVYNFNSLIGRGGMGRVYLVRHGTLHRKCALKILSPRIASKDVDYVARFQHEGRSAAALVHPNIVTTHAIGEADGYHYLEMEFVSGCSLQELISTEGRLTPVRATALALQVARGLTAAHREGIIHRDLKPDNVLLTTQGVAKIADFGLAKRVLDRDGVPAERIVGTPNFMAPELFAGTAASKSSDVYALGVCYYKLLTGKYPFVAGSLPALMNTIARETPPPVRLEFPDVPLEMAECLQMLMAKSPENRPRDAVEAAQLLEAVLGQQRDVESLLIEAFAGNDGVAWTRSGKRYELCFTLADGRRQNVFVEPSGHSGAERLLLIYSVCCPADPGYYEDALRLNSELPHGSLAVRDVDGEKHFVMVDTYPRATVDVEEIRRSVVEVAFRADELENLLTGEDRH